MFMPSSEILETFRAVDTTRHRKAQRLINFEVAPDKMAGKGLGNLTAEQVNFEVDEQKVKLVLHRFVRAFIFSALGVTLIRRAARAKPPSVLGKRSHADRVEQKHKQNAPEYLLEERLMEAVVDFLCEYIVGTLKVTTDQAARITTFFSKLMANYIVDLTQWPARPTNWCKSFSLVLINYIEDAMLLVK